MKRKVYLHLTGGLGNQLFQLAAALKLADGEPIYISTLNGRPRLGPGSLPDLQSFILPANIFDLGDKKYSALAAKTAGYHLRRGISPRPWERGILIRSASLAVTNIINSIYFRAPIKTFVADDVGNVNLPILKGPIFLIGYFQTSIIGSSTEVFNVLTNLELTQKNSIVSAYEYLSSVETPLVIHIRRSDYKTEDKFGLVGAQYYFDAIDEILTLRDFKKIWVFSDDFEAAESIIHRIKKAYPLPIRLIDDQSLSAAETLEIMRYGHGFIIANSTFSWWGAFLTKHEKAPVVAPTPWFISLPEPKGLIPDCWRRLNGDYS